MVNDYEVRNAEIEQVLRELGGDIADKLPDGWGFSLHIFSFGAGATFYISNANRGDMLDMLQEFIDKNRGKAE